MAKFDLIYNRKIKILSKMLNQRVRYLPLAVHKHNPGLAKNSYSSVRSKVDHKRVKIRRIPKSNSQDRDEFESNYKFKSNACSMNQ